MSVYLVLRPLQDHGLWLFLGGIVLATILEYVTSWVMEKLFHTSWWDYSERPFNLHGRICLGCSIAWGFFTLLMFEILQPFAQWVIDLFDVATDMRLLSYAGFCTAWTLSYRHLQHCSSAKNWKACRLPWKSLPNIFRRPKSTVRRKRQENCLETIKSICRRKKNFRKSWESIKGTLQARLKKRVFLNMQKAFALVQRDFGNSIRRGFLGSPA